MTLTAITKKTAISTVFSWMLKAEKCKKDPTIQKRPTMSEITIANLAFCFLFIGDTYIEKIESLKMERLA